MTSKLKINSDLAKQAQLLGKQTDISDTINDALKEYVDKRKKTAIFDAFGTFEFDQNYDYKAERRRKRS